MAKVTIKAEDLFFLSKLMHAKYLDYDYVSMMEDLSHRFSVKEAEAMNHLNDAGLIFEDFGGDIEIEDQAKELFDPIFFGTFESELLIEDSMNFERYKYHVLDGRYVEVKMENKNLIVQTIEKEAILNHLPYMEEVEPKTYPINYFKDVQVEGILVIKRLKFGHSPVVIQLLNDAGVYYQAKGNNIHSMTKNELKTLLQKNLWED